ncbi:MAG TPA: rhodanese-like domain-containing protein [Gemmatimonadaceae bacterium]|jgi:rhodanese-related sulfurtransferase|nr:rhodanese-like domain-containing protein [Gemmatimonadaceae bacterium]
MSNKSGTDLINDAKTRIREVRAADAVANPDPSVVYFDCREPNEYALGHIPGAVFIPRGNLETKVEAAIPRDKKILIYCATGNRSALAADTMQQMGYTDVASMADGFRGWVDAGGDVE